MKKYLLLFISVVCFTTLSIVPATAQKKSNVGTYIQKYFWGPKIGLNIATFSNADDAVALKGLVLGVFGEYKYQPNLGFSAELLYSQQGAMIEDFDDMGFHADYLIIPIMANWYFGGLGLKVGLQPGILLSNELTGGKQKVDVSESSNSLDISIPVGVSYSFDFGLKFEARYNIGLSKVFKDDSSDLGNMVIQLTVGYIF
jgi:hypothetical protein